LLVRYRSNNKNNNRNNNNKNNIKQVVKSNRTTAAADAQLQTTALHRRMWSVGWLGVATSRMLCCCGEEVEVKGEKDDGDVDVQVKLVSCSFFYSSVILTV